MWSKEEAKYNEIQKFIAIIFSNQKINLTSIYKTNDSCQCSLEINTEPHMVSALSDKIH